MAVVYYYYAYVEENVCLDIERTRKEKTDLENYVQVSVKEYNAYMDEDTASEYYIIGKVWNGSAWVEPAKNYYAVINEKGICVNMLASLTEIEDASYISIPKAAFDAKAYINKKYSHETLDFDAVGFSEYADADTTRISVNGSEVDLQTFLNNLQSAIDNAGTSLSAVDILAMLSQVDGSTSCLDADMLDGMDSSAFAKVAQLNDLQFSLLDTISAVDTKVNSINSTVSNNTSKIAEVSTKIAEVSTKVDKAAGKFPYEIGFYKGTGEGAQDISIGFRPRAVLIFPNDGVTSDDGKRCGGLYTDGTYAGMDGKYGCVINDDGFTVFTYRSDSLYLNSDTRAFIAFK